MEITLFINIMENHGIVFLNLCGNPDWLVCTLLFLISYAQVWFSYDKTYGFLLYLQKTSMIIGIDVYHDKSQKKQSIAGFVASTNALCTRWYSRVCIQPASQELIDGLKMCMISAITKYHEVSTLNP